MTEALPGHEVLRLDVRVAEESKRVASRRITESSTAPSMDEVRQSVDRIRELEISEISKDSLKCLVDYIRAIATTPVELKEMMLDLFHTDSSLPPCALGRVLLAFSEEGALQLGRSGLTDDMSDVISHCITSAPVLQQVDLSHNKFTSKGIHTILESLRDAKVSMDRMDLSGNRLNVRAANTLAELLMGPTASTLRRLHLTHCGLDEVTAPIVAEALHRCTALEVLDVSSNDYASAGIAADESCRLPPSLRVLNVSHNVIKPSAAQRVAMGLTASCAHLEELRLSGSIPGDRVLSQFFTELRSLPALRLLDMSHCELSYQVAKLLAQKLVVFSCLETVLLHRNPLSVEGASDLSSGFERMTRLRSLNLSHCGIGNCGAASVARSLVRGNAPLRELDLSYNSINDAGVRDVCTLLDREDCPQLTLLVLSGSLCTLGARTQLVEMMQGRQAACTVIAHDTPLESVAREVESQRNDCY